MNIGIDLGTANVLVHVEGKGIVIQEPSVVAVDDDGRIRAVGEDAREMIGRTPGNIHAIRPMKDGVIADYVITEAMLRFFINKAMSGRMRMRLSGPVVMISVPAGVTSVEKRAVKDAALKAGAREAYLIEEPLAAAIGANVPISGPVGEHDHRHRRRDQRDRGHRARRDRRVDLAAGRREPVRRVDHLVHPQEVQPDDRRAHGRGSEDHDRDGPPARARAVHGGSRARPHRRAPRTIPITSSEVMEAIELPLQQLVAAVRHVLEQTPPELSSDIIDKGMVMSGGGALLRNIDKLLTQVTGVPCHVAENALDCVALGTGEALKHYDFFKKSLVQSI